MLTEVKAKHIYIQRGLSVYKHFPEVHRSYIFSQNNICRELSRNKLYSYMYARVFGIKINEKFHTKPRNHVRVWNKNQTNKMQGYSHEMESNIHVSRQWGIVDMW